MRAPKAKSFLKNWPFIGLPAFALLFLPWQDKLTSMSLVSDWFQPTLNVAASIVGPLACLVGFAVLAQTSKTRKTSAMILSSLVFTGCVVVCLFLRMALGTIIFPSPPVQVTIWTLHALLYLLAFASLAIAMISGGLLVEGPARSSLVAGRADLTSGRWQDTEGRSPDIGSGSERQAVDGGKLVHGETYRRAGRIAGTTARHK